MRARMFTIAVAAVFAGALAACQTETPYQPAGPGQAQSGGYSESKIEADRWQVTFNGNDLTSRATVETYLLYRAAELTVAQGDDWFEAVDRRTDKHAYVYSNDPFGWSPSWRFHRHGFGWAVGYWPDDFDLETVERYEASAEIVLHHGAKPAGDPRAFDAREVMANLGPKIVRPH